MRPCRHPLTPSAVRGLAHKSLAHALAWRHVGRRATAGRLLDWLADAVRTEYTEVLGSPLGSPLPPHRRRRLKVLVSDRLTKNT